MELESLFRKSATTFAIGIFQLPTLKKKINKDLRDPKFWKKGLKARATQIQDRAIEELDNVYSLPEIIKDEVLNMLGLLSIEVTEYTKIYKELGCLRYGIIDDFIWDSNGTVNNLETCKRILKRDLDLDVKIRLACTYCLEEEVHSLLLTKDGYWTRQLDDILFEDNSNPNNILIRYWFERLREKKTKKMIKCKVSDKEALDCAMLQWNETATKYLFEKLTLKDEYLLIRDFCIMPEMAEKQNLHEKSEFLKIQKNHVLFFMVKQCEAENLQNLWQKSPELPKTLLQCLLSFTYRNYFFLYGKVLLRQIRDEKYFCELLIDAASNLLTDPKIYEKIYLAIWNNYCLKHKYVNLLLFHDRQRKLITNLLLAGKYNFVHLLVNRHKDDCKFDFFCKNAKTMAINLIPSGKQNILKNIAVSCLLTRENVVQFKDEWNDNIRIEKKCSAYDEIMGEIVPVMQEIINNLLQSFGED